LRHQIKIAEIVENPDGSAQLILEFDEETKQFLMNTWGVTEWDEARASAELTEAISRAMKEEENVTQEEG
jgi:hypothetical protein